MDFYTVLAVFFFIAALIYLICCVVIFFIAQDALMDDKGIKKMFIENADQGGEEDMYKSKTVRKILYSDTKPSFFSKYLLYQSYLIELAGGSMQSLQKKIMDSSVVSLTNPNYRGQLGLLPSKDLPPVDASFCQAGIYENSLAAIVAALEGQVDLCQSICTSLVTLVMYEGAKVQSEYDAEKQYFWQIFKSLQECEDYHGLRARYSAIHGTPNTDPEYAVDTITCRGVQKPVQCGRMDNNIAMLAWRRTEMGYQASTNAWVSLALAFVVNFLGEEVLSKELCDLYLGASSFVLEFLLTKTKTEDIFEYSSNRTDSETAVDIQTCSYNSVTKVLGECRRDGVEQKATHTFGDGYAAYLDDFDSANKTKDDVRTYSFDDYIKQPDNPFYSDKDTTNTGNDFDTIKKYYRNKLESDIEKTQRKKKNHEERQQNEYSATTKTSDHAIILGAIQQLKTAVALRTNNPNSTYNIPNFLQSEFLKTCEKRCHTVMDDMLNYSTPNIAKKFLSRTNYYSSAVVEIIKKKNAPVGTQFATNINLGSNYEFVAEPTKDIKDILKEKANSFSWDEWKGKTFTADFSIEDNNVFTENNKCVVKVNQNFNYYVSGFAEAGSMYGNVAYTMEPYMQYYKQIQDPNTGKITEDQIYKIQVGYNNNMDTRLFGSNAKSQFFPILCSHLYKNNVLDETSMVNKNLSTYFETHTDGRSIDDIIKWAVDNLAVQDSFDSPAGCGTKTHADPSQAYDPCNMSSVDGGNDLSGIFFGFANAPSATAMYNAIDFECTAIGTMAFLKHFFTSLLPRIKDPSFDNNDKLDAQRLAAEMIEKINSRLASMLRISSRSKKVYMKSQTKGVPGSTHMKEFYEGKANPNLSGEGFSKFRYSDTAATCWTYLSLQYASLVAQHPDLAELFNPLTTDVFSMVGDKADTLLSKGLRSLTTEATNGYTWKNVGSTKSDAWYKNIKDILSFFAASYTKTTSKELRTKYFTDTTQDNTLRFCKECSCNDLEFNSVGGQAQGKSQSTFEDVSAKLSVAFYTSVFQNMSHAQIDDYTNLKENLNVNIGNTKYSPEDLFKSEIFINEPCYRVQSQMVRRFIMENFNKAKRTQKENSVDYDEEKLCAFDLTKPPSNKVTSYEYYGWKIEEDYGYDKDFQELSKLFYTLDDTNPKKNVIGKL